MDENFRCGYITIIGRPNVGKSTLLNKILGQKISATSRKPQTTRWHLLGIKTNTNCQAIYVDTPGVQNKYMDGINRHMAKEVTNSLANVDIVIFMIEPLSWADEEEHIMGLLDQLTISLFLVVNKIDKVKDKDKLLPFIEKIANFDKFAEILPVSVHNGSNVKKLEDIVYSYLPAAPKEFSDEQFSDRNERFFAAEFIREKLVRTLGEELPYRISVSIEQFKLKENVLHIYATIWAEGQRHKKIIVGKNGAILKSVGVQSRKDMENMFEHKVFLQTWVKVKEKWTENAKALKQFGYNSQTF